MKKRNKRRILFGKVVSDKMNKTVVVEIVKHIKHKLYKKVLTRTKRYKSHDENNSCKIGDRIKMMETRPLSKTKRWRIVEIVENAK
ncbi:MAG: 30S ribosomal protein S17 [Clostridiales bacterium]|nr:30S ribosomal protein S17 [Clostridiales bacterium]